MIKNAFLKAGSMPYPSFMFPKIRLLKCTIPFVVLIIVITGCAADQPYQIDLMPAPDIFSAIGWQPFSDTSPAKDGSTIEILFATDRTPAEEEDKETYYQNERGYVLRLGKGEVNLGQGEYTWEEMKRVSLLKNRTENLPLQVIGAEEYGILHTTVTEFDPPELQGLISEQPAKRYASLINDKLDRSNKKDIYIYVHGYKVNFENPVLVSSELWHFLGYEGVFIAYAWPSTPSVWAYASDAETAAVSSRNLRLFVQYLAEKTTALNIHIIGYSMGTRLVADALNELALINSGKELKNVREQLRMGHVVLVGSDIDEGIFANMFLNGILNIVGGISVYVSAGDKALGLSEWLFDRERLGQFARDREIEENTANLLLRYPNLNFIDVTEAEGAMTGNGHAYFRKSPWASSDILVTLMYDLPPGERGLVRSNGNPIWTFPSDYVQKLRSIIAENYPALVPR